MNLSENDHPNLRNAQTLHTGMSSICWRTGVIAPDASLDLTQHSSPVSSVESMLGSIKRRALLTPGCLGAAPDATRVSGFLSSRCCTCWEVRNNYVFQGDSQTLALYWNEPEHFTAFIISELHRTTHREDIFQFMVNDWPYEWADHTNSSMRLCIKGQALSDDESHQDSGDIWTTSHDLDRRCKQPTFVFS